MACVEGSSSALLAAGFHALPATRGMTASYFTVKGSRSVLALCEVTAVVFFSEARPKLAAGARGLTMASEGMAG
jgi:hypothetical protein